MAVRKIEWLHLIGEVIVVMMMMMVVMMMLVLWRCRIEGVIVFAFALSFWFSFTYFVVALSRG